jgi:hypothetical protein
MLSNDAEPMTAPILTPAFRLSLTYAPPLRYPSTTGRRAALRIAEGRAEGALVAEVADDGGELLLIRADGVIELDSRMMLRADDGTMLYWRARGYVIATPEAASAFAGGAPLPPAPLTLAPYFDAPAGAWDWTTRTLFAARGTLGSDSAAIDVYRMEG